MAVSDLLVGEALVAELVARIGGVADELTKEDLLVTVEGIDDLSIDKVAETNSAAMNDIATYRMKQQIKLLAIHEKIIALLLFSGNIKLTHSP